MRRFVFGDIHGCAKALRALIEQIDPTAEDQLIFLGDYVDRGPDSRDVVDQLIELKQRCHLITLRGNHEIMLLGVALRGLDRDPWLQSGGHATVTSYGGSLDKIPADHLAFFQDLERYYECHDAIFVHAGYRPDQEMSAQDDAVTFWAHLPYSPPPPHKSGKRVYVGHTPQPSGNVLNYGHLLCVDTYCFGGKYLTAMNVDTHEILQANLHGHLRRPPIAVMAERLSRYRRWLSAMWRKRIAGRHARTTRGGDAQSTQDSTIEPSEVADARSAAETPAVPVVSGKLDASS